jgi:translocation and assembly module TamA
MGFGPADPPFRLARLAGAALVLLVCTESARAQTGRTPVTGAPDALAAELARILPEEPAPQSLFEARRQAERAADLVARLMESEGYYAAEVVPEAELGPPLERRVRVRPGARFTLAASRLAFPDGPPDPATLALLDSLLEPLSAGAPARAQPVLDAGDAMLRTLREQGYPDASSDPVDALADARAQTMELTFILRPGPRLTLGDIEVSGLERTRRDFIEAMAPWKPGDRFSPIRLEDYRARIAATGLFDTVSVDLGEAPASAGTPAAGAPETGNRPVVVTVLEGPRRTVAFGGSASTSEGLGVDGEWEMRNLTGRGDALALRAMLATLQSSAGVSYRRPNVGRYGRNAVFDLGADRFETDAFDQSGVKASAVLEDQITPRLRGSVGVETAYASIADARARDLGLARRDVWLVGAAATAEYVGVRDVLDPASGVRARVAVEPGVTWGETEIGFTRLSTEASLYGNLGSDRWIGAVRARLGAIFGPNGAPPDKLFFAGGGGSVRGYDYQSLSPRDGEGTLVGGRSLAEASAEVRWRASQRLGFAAFVDAGAAGAGIDPPLADMRAGAGLGLRYYAGFGPLRLDVAAPLDKRAGDSDFQVYLSIGQAF